MISNTEPGQALTKGARLHMPQQAPPIDRIDTTSGALSTPAGIKANGRLGDGISSIGKGIDSIGKGIGKIIPI
ncbi:hypothetical protein [Streptomyces sp. NPDC059787]|uniref:hypothetical protein n=1 Tax=Streptomyces sp. NPDC059787 TaxID=3346947 RepID=UPI0036528B29